MTLEVFFEYYMAGEGTTGDRAYRALAAAGLDSVWKIQQFRTNHHFKHLDHVGPKVNYAIVRGLARLDAAAIAQVATMES
jgi:hypothetical protein